MSVYSYVYLITQVKNVLTKLPILCKIAMFSEIAIILRSYGAIFLKIQAFFTK